jgi:hypothetical protein
MDVAKLALFLSGLFLGGAFDHVFLALRKSSVTPYGFRLGVRSNWLLASVDLTLAAFLYLLHSILTDQSRKSRP